jgi:hypothetical protein
MESSWDGRVDVTEGPAWWRGQVADQMPTWQPEDRVFTGQVDDLDVSGVPLGRGLLRAVVFDQARVSDADISLDDIGLVTAWSEFTECTFHQRGTRLHPDGEEPQGSFGNRPSVFRGCTFRDVRLSVRAGFSVGQARFEDCTFERCRFEEHFSWSAEYVGCRFVGPMRTAVFFGTDPNSGRVNEIHDNDFTDVAFSSNVGWRGDFPVLDQRWPESFTPLVDDS